MACSRTTLVLACLCALLAGALGRDLLVRPAHADERTGFRNQEVRELLRSLERNAQATKEVADAVRALRR